MTRCPWEPAQALDALLRALAVPSEHVPPAAEARAILYRYGEGMALNNLGLVLLEVGRFDEAIEAHQHAAARFHETGDGRNEAIAMRNLEEDLVAKQTDHGIRTGS